MGMVINTNVDALDALRNLGITANKFSASVQKLSSGLRINTAADDAAGLAISNKLQAQVNGLNQAQRNAQDGVSMVQTASGALNEITSMLQRVRELAVEAANATVGSSDAASINTEVAALQTEINRISGATTFNGQNLLTGAMSVSQAAGSTAKAGVALAASTGTISAVDVSAAKAGSTYTLASTGGAGTLTMTLGTVSQTVNLQAMTASGTQTISFGQLGISITVAAAPAATAANLSTDLAGLNVQTSAGNNTANFQIGANATDTMTVTFGNVNTSQYTGFDGAVTGLNTAVGSQAAWTANQGTATAALINAADKGIDYVNGIASSLGAVQNRLGHTIAAVGVASENLNASQSRIKDLNVADEMVNFTKTQILQQAGTAILAQANSAPQSILTLLR
jgi:flagellin